MRAKIEAANGVGFSPRTLRRYLLENDPTCSICGLEQWNGHPTPLVMDHIDGNPMDDRLENLRLVCPNCDAQLPTYKAKNKGSGREWRRQKYAEGKRY